MSAEKTNQEILGEWNAKAKAAGLYLGRDPWSIPPAQGSLLDIQETVESQARVARLRQEISDLQRLPQQEETSPACRTGGSDCGQRQAAGGPQQLEPQIGRHQLGQVKRFNSGDLSFLEESLHEMFSIIEAYMAEFSTEVPDRPYAYNERATLGLLMGGIWRSDRKNLVLEEWCGQKHCKTGAYSGRFDAWFRVKGQCCYMEAKQCYMPFVGFGPKAAMKVIEVARGEANSSLLNVMAGLQCGAVDHALGMVFLVPYITKRQRKKGDAAIRAYTGALDSALQEMTADGSCGVLLGRYLRLDQLGDKYFDGSQTYPMLDVLVCEAARPN